MLVLLLALARIGWKLANRGNPVPVPMPGWQKKAAAAGHGLLYLLILLQPLSGWAMSSAANYPVTLFGWFQFPALVGANHDLHEGLEEVHEVLFYDTGDRRARACGGGRLPPLLDEGRHAAADAAVRPEAGRVTLRPPQSAAGWVLAALLAATPAPAVTASSQATTWTTVTVSSSIEFTGTLAGGDFTGQFQRFIAAIAFDPANLAGSRFRVEIETASANTADADTGRGPGGWRLLRHGPLAKGHLRGEPVRRDRTWPVPGAWQADDSRDRRGTCRSRSPSSRPRTSAVRSCPVAPACAGSTSGSGRANGRTRSGWVTRFASASNSPSGSRGHSPGRGHSPCRRVSPPR